MGKVGLQNRKNPAETVFATGACGTWPLVFEGIIYLPLVSREWKNGSNSSYNCTPFLHSLLTNLVCSHPFGVGVRGLGV